MANKPKLGMARIRYMYAERTRLLAWNGKVGTMPGCDGKTLTGTDQSRESRSHLTGWRPQVAPGEQTSGLDHTEFQYTMPDK